MDNWWIYLPQFAFLLFWLGDRDAMWTHFNSQQVKEICAHMTLEEKRSTTVRNAVFRLGAVVSLGMVPLCAILFVQRFSTLINLVSVWFFILFLILNVCAFLKWLGYYNEHLRKFLASTEWSKKQGLRLDDIVMRKF